MTDQVETCRPDIYTSVYKINVVLQTNVQYLFICCNTSGWKTSNLELVKLVPSISIRIPDPSFSKVVQISILKNNNSWICFLEGLRMTDQVETCRPDIYTSVYKINVVLLTDVQYLLYVVTLRDGKLKKMEILLFILLPDDLLKHFHVSSG